MILRELNVPAAAILVTIAMVAVLSYQPELSYIPAPQIDQLSKAMQTNEIKSPLGTLRMAARQGNVNAMRALGSALLGDADYSRSLEGLHFMEEAAKRGDKEAQFLLGKAYFDGVATITKLPDMGRARTWFDIAAEHEHPGAMYYLGLIYRFGYGVERDEERSGYWMGMAAGRGYGDAVIALENNES